MKQLNESQILQKWRLPNHGETDKNGKWIHDKRLQKIRLRELKIQKIKEYKEDK